MRCLIIDDEPLAQLEMRRLLSVHADVEGIDCAADIETALKICRAQPPEVIFLDIQLRGESGFDFLNQAPHPCPPIVFVTAFDRYAIRAFDYNALDYLLKPVHPERLQETLARLRKVIAVPNRDGLLLPMNGIVRRVTWEEINSIESEGNYTRVNLADGSSAMILRRLKEWMEIVPEEIVQAHRTALVRLGAVREIRPIADGRRELVLDQGKILPVSRNCWPNLKQRLG